MKKILLPIAVVLLMITFSNCNKSEDSKEQKISDRISSLETSLNSYDLPAFLSNFDSSCSLDGAYPTANWDSLTLTQTRKFSFSVPVITGNTAVVASTYTPGVAHEETFTLVETDGEWYIYLWITDGDTENPIFYTPKQLLENVESGTDTVEQDSN